MHDLSIQKIELFKETEGERKVKVIGCSNLREGGGELGTNKKLDL